MRPAAHWVNAWPNWPVASLERYSMHPLKVVCLATWLVLFVSQLLLLLPATGIAYYWVLLLITPLLIPLKGLVSDKRYTYKWVGFITLFYFCIGISELVANPSLRVYASITTGASLLLFLASIYYARFLGLRG